MNWRYQGISKGDKTGPLRDVWYMLEYLGAEVGNNISQIPGAPHLFGGAANVVSNFYAAAPGGVNLIGDDEFKPYGSLGGLWP